MPHCATHTHTGHHLQFPSQEKAAAFLLSRLSAWTGQTGLEQAEASGAASQRGTTVRECQLEAH